MSFSSQIKQHNERKEINHGPEKKPTWETGLDLLTDSPVLVYDLTVGKNSGIIYLFTQLSCFFFCFFFLTKLF